MGMKRIPYMLAVFALFFAVLSAVLSSDVSAQGLERYDVDFNIAYGRVVVDKEMVFNIPVKDEIYLDVPDDVEKPSLYLDGNFVESEAGDGRIKAILNSAKSIKLNYVTGEFIDKSEFIVSMRVPYDTDNFRITLTLPSHAVLERPLPESSISPSPVYPLPKEVTTDGLSMKLMWEYNDLKKNDEKSFFVRFSEKKDYSYLIWVLVIVVITLIIAVAFLLKRKPKVERVVEKVVEKEDMLEKHLKEDEEQVVNILKQREGQCEQGTLRVITGFSKAKLSGLLKELEERNVVHKEKRGKKNLVFLRKL